MTQDSTFNPDMLKLARDTNQITQTQLAKRAGLTQAFMSKLEHGLITQPSKESVEAISSALGFPNSFFFQRERAIGFPHFHFRKRARLGRKALDRIEAIINIRRQHIARLLSSFEVEIQRTIPQIDLDESGLTPEEAAERVRAYWLVPKGPIQSVTELIEEAGGVVVISSFDTNLLDGVSFRAERMPPLFFMNKDVPGDRFRFSLAHELGHMVMHSLPDDDDKMEKEAHRFASAFLMPRKEIRPYLVNTKLANLGKVKSYWRVSIKALIVAAHDLKLTTDHQYKSLNIQYNKVFRGREPIEVPLETASAIERMVDYHTDILEFSLEDLAELLRITPAHAQSLYGKNDCGPRLIVSN